MSTSKPVRVLHSVGSLNRGGIETWLMHVVRQRHPDLKIDFILSAQPGESGDYEREAIAAGCVIHNRPYESRVAKRLRMLGLAHTSTKLVDTLRAGQYDVLHVHGDEFNGDTVKEAFGAGTPVRVAHCHHTQIARGKGGPEMWVRWARYLTLDRARTMRYATDLVACGRDAGHLMVGDRWETDSRCRVIYCGVTLAAFDRAITQTSRADLLARHQLPADAIVVGHAGSMGPVPVKNHSFLMRAFAELAKRDSRYHLFMAGDGPLRPKIEAEVHALRIANRVRMPGLLPDVPAHMTHLFDVHVLPSLSEGLPVVAIEAAAAGLYSILSDRITNELAEHLPGRTEQLALEAPLAKWADRIEYGITQRESPLVGIARVRATPLSIERSVQDLVDMYRRRISAAL
jgi:glycosyltransferase involved in cell wall biosynthesis